MEIAYTSLERMIVAALLTEGGRLYLSGAPEDTCNYAFVQDPRVSSDASRLYVRFLFAGSAGKVVRDKCIGTGDNFDVVVSGVPRYANGELYLEDMNSRRRAVCSISSRASSKASCSPDFVFL